MNNGKKFPELKMMVNGDYKSSNHTMSSDDEVFNVSVLFCYPIHFMHSYSSLQ